MTTVLRDLNLKQNLTFENTRENTYQDETYQESGLRQQRSTHDKIRVDGASEGQSVSRSSISGSKNGSKSDDVVSLEYAK